MSCSDNPHLITDWLFIVTVHHTGDLYHWVQLIVWIFIPSCCRWAVMKDSFNCHNVEHIVDVKLGKCCGKSRKNSICVYGCILTVIITALAQMALSCVVPLIVCRWCPAFRESSNNSTRSPLKTTMVIQDDSLPAPTPPQIRILKRPASNGSLGSPLNQNRPTPQVKSLAQREAEYAEARKRILGSACPEETPQDKPNTDR